MSSLRDFFSLIPSSDNPELRQACFHTLTLIIVLIVGAAGYAVYCVLQVFIRPLLWALLVGICLHPFKRRMTETLRGWLTSLKVSGTPLTLSLTTLPFDVMSSVAESVFSILVKYAKLLFAFIIALPVSYLLYHYGPLNRLLMYVVSSIKFISNFLQWFNTFWFLTIIVGYVLAVLFLWNQSTAVWLKGLSIPVWILTILHIAAVSGPLRVPLFLALMVLLVVGRLSLIGRDKVKGAKPSGLSGFQQIFRYIKAKPSENDGDATRSSVQEVIKEEAETEERLAEGMQLPDESSMNGANGDGEKEAEASTEESFNPETASTPYPAAEDGKENVKVRKKRSSSYKFFIFLFWAHVAVYMWSHAWVIQLLPIPVVIVVVKKLCSRLGGRAALRHYLILLKMKLENVLGDRLDVLAPAPVRGIFKLLLVGDNKIREMLDSTLDSVVSIVVILLVLFGTIGLTLFLVFQINRESVQLVSMTSDVLNKTMHSDLLTWMPQRENMQQLFESMVGNVYLFGREWISKKIENFFDTDSYNKAKIEEQALELWDRLYQRVVSKNETRDATPHIMRSASFSSLPASVQGLWETVWSIDTLSLSYAINFVKENIGILMSVVESIWLLLKGNFSLCLSVMSAVFSIILGGGTALLNFLLSLIIFMSTLYYLLAYSQRDFLPMELIGQYYHNTKSVIPYVGPVINAFQIGVSGVFTASLKMAVFYGFYTLLTHLVFGVSLVVIPSVLAALFAAVPFLGTYWAALPGIIELALICQEPILAIILFSCHILPMYFVDVSIYKEIHGIGHPYLTGLAIAGGIYYYGLEGAITGPILLCLLLTVVNLYFRVFIADSTKTTKPQYSRRSSCI